MKDLKSISIGEELIKFFEGVNKLEEEMYSKIGISKSRIGEEDIENKKNNVNLALNNIKYNDKKD